MIFRNREEAARKLAEALKRFSAHPDTVVLALPRGGVVLGRIVADALALPLDIVVPRKIGAPGNEEYAIGAITEAGDAVWNAAERARTSDSYVARVVAAERAEAQRRLKTYRLTDEPRDLLGKTVIVVDDGIATGLTMRAALATIRHEGAARVIVAVPVCPADTQQELSSTVDELIVLQSPEYFGGVGAWYEVFPQVDDETVVELLRPHPL